jgi:hypothetical protein
MDKLEEEYKEREKSLELLKKQGKPIKPNWKWGMESCAKELMK